MDPKHSKIIAGSAIGVAALFAAIATLTQQPQTAQLTDSPVSAYTPPSYAPVNNAIPPGAKETPAPSTAALTSKDILVIGDSQVTETSWVGLGIKEAGFTPRMYRCGGVGFVTSTADCYSYYEGIVKGHWALPTGSPKAIYINASGNDLSHDHDEVMEAQGDVIKALKKRYPKATIILAGVVSKEDSSHDKRRSYSADASTIAINEGIKFINVDGWLTKYLNAEDLKDTVHLTDAAQPKLATHLAEQIRIALGLATPTPSATPEPEESAEPEESESPTPEPSESPSEEPSESPTPEETTPSPTPIPSPTTNSPAAPKPQQPVAPSAKQSSSTSPAPLPPTSSSTQGKR